MKTWSPDLARKAWNFASRAHRKQSLPGNDVPYLNHVGNVAMEVMSALARGEEVENPDLAVQCAFLHDVIEDTETTLEEVRREFGPGVAAGVESLSKDKALPDKAAQMRDSLERIRRQPKEVWMVKLADRISNLQKPPHYWDAAKIVRYREEASEILESLGSASFLLSQRLAEKIELYRVHLSPDLL